MAFNYGNSQKPRPELMDYERVGHLSLGGPPQSAPSYSGPSYSGSSHSGSTGGLQGYSPEYQKDMYPTVPLRSPNEDLTDDEDSKEPIIKKLFTGEKVIMKR